MEQIKNLLFNDLRKHPGIRMRNIPSLAHMTLIDKIKLLNELEKQGKIYKKIYNDPAQMEYYYEWFLNEKV